LHCTNPIHVREYDDGQYFEPWFAHACHEQLSRWHVAVPDLLPCSSVDVEGVFVGTLSPIKSSRSRTDTKYYDGSISDGVKTVRFVSFEPKLRKQIEEAYDNNYGVSLSNCAVKRG